MTNRRLILCERTDTGIAHPEAPAPIFRDQRSIPMKADLPKPTHFLGLR